jgi:hypothetical protein
MNIDVSEYRAQIGGSVLVPGDEGFEENLHRWAANAERKAAVIVRHLLISVLQCVSENIANISSRMQRRVG